MNMYSMIEDARNQALEKANEWADCEEARELLAKIDAYVTLSDRWYGEVPGVAKAFSEAALDAEDALENMRSEIVFKCAEEICGHRDYGTPEDDGYDAAWEAADEDAPTVKQLINQALHYHAGDEYLRRFG